MSIFKKIGLLLASVFTSLFNASKAAYEKLTPEQQLALQQGSDFVEVIKGMASATPAEIRAALQAKFPNLNEAELEAGMFKVANAFGFKPTTLDEAIAVVVDHIKDPSHNSDVLEVIFHTAASAFAFFVAPPGTKFTIVASLMEWFYQHFVKKSTADAAIAA